MDGRMPRYRLLPAMLALGMVVVLAALLAVQSAGVGSGLLGTTGGTITYNVSITGSGTLKTADGNLNCVTPQCTGGTVQFAPGTRQTLQAIPAPNWTFNRWTGDCATTLFLTECIITAMDGRSAGVIFDPPITYSVGITGSGTLKTADGNLNCVTPQCTGGTVEFVPGSSQTLQAVPAPNWTFKVWTGDCYSTTSPTECTITARNGGSAGVIFAPPITYNVSITGSGTLKSADGILNCTTPQCTGGTVEFPTDRFYDFARVELRAVPAPGWAVNNWTGDCVQYRASVGCAVLAHNGGSAGVVFRNTQDDP